MVISRFFRMIIPIGLVVAAPTAHAGDYPWLGQVPVSRPLVSAVQPPGGFKRVKVGKRSFAAWLRCYVA